MNQQTSQPGVKVDMRAAMPLTAAQVADWRIRFGKDYVNNCIKASLGGEPNRFYAIEGGNFLGTQFDWAFEGAVAVSMGLLRGDKCVVGILDPKGVVELTIKQSGANGTPADKPAQSDQPNLG